MDTYSGDACRSELTSLQTCFSGVTFPPPALNILSSIDQEIGESDAVVLMNGLTFLSPSQQCVEAITPFLCLYIFNLCDSNGTLHIITRGDCINVRDDVCTSEWNQAIVTFGSEVLPVCEDLPDLTEVCIGKLLGDTIMLDMLPCNIALSRECYM